VTGGLVLRLAPGERVLVNGVVIENGDRRARLRVKTADAHILRLRDAIHPDEAKTPARRLYYIAQLAVAGEADADEARAQILEGLAALRAALGEHPCAADIEAAMQNAREKRFYHVMRALVGVMKDETVLLLAASMRDASAAPGPARAG
jgi:flagellar protein FlbT